MTMFLFWLLLAKQPPGCVIYDTIPNNPPTVVIQPQQPANTSVGPLPLVATRHGNPPSPMDIGCKTLILGHQSQ